MLLGRKCIDALLWVLLRMLRLQLDLFTMLVCCLFCTVQRHLLAHTWLHPSPSMHVHLFASMLARGLPVLLQPLVMTHDVVCCLSWLLSCCGRLPYLLFG
jgi:hypothetical protein